jgi:hypothetical protein
MAVSTYELYKLPIYCITILLTYTLTTLTFFLYLVVGFVVYIRMHGRQIVTLCDFYIHMYPLPSLDLESEKDLFLYLKVVNKEVQEHRVQILVQN